MKFISTFKNNPPGILSFGSAPHWSPSTALGSRVPEEDEEVGGKSGREERLKSIV